jgi:predicted amidohydrolase YtcJ
MSSESQPFHRRFIAFIAFDADFTGGAIRRRNLPGSIENVKAPFPRPGGRLERGHAEGPALSPVFIPKDPPMTTALVRALALATLLTGCGGAAQPSLEELNSMSPKTLLIADAVLTMVSGAPTAEAIVLDADRIDFVGSLEAARARAGADAVVESFPGATIVPGLVDTHAHLTGLGKALMEVDLAGARSEREAVDRVIAAASTLPPGTPAEGRGWDQNDWPGGEFPDHSLLTAAFPDRPVVLRRVDGHAVWVNAAALALGAIARETPDPAGGRIVRGPDGEATGVLIDAAMGLVTARLPPATPGQIRIWIEAAIATCHAVGLTGMHDAGTSAAQLAVLEHMAAEGALPLRVHVLLDADDPAAFERLARPPTLGAFLAVRGLKIFADGALGSRGAHLGAPYSDAPETRGLALIDPANLRERVRRATEAGYQVGVHAIGDAAAHEVLGVYSTVLQPGDDRRFRLEHAQVVAPADQAEMARLGVIAAIQPTHATSDMDWAERRLGPERIRWAYAWQSLRRAGVRLALGSDFPVERPAVVEGLLAATTRRDAAGHPPGGWYPEERLTMDEALAGFTTDAAFAGFVESRRGQIQPGFDADLTVLGAHPQSAPAGVLREKGVRATIVAGRVVYRARP